MTDLVNKFKELKFIKKIVVFSIAFIVIYIIISMIYQFIFREEMSPTLTDNVVSFFGKELVCTLVLQIISIIRKSNKKDDEDDEDSEVDQDLINNIALQNEDGLGEIGGNYYVDSQTGQYSQSSSWQQYFSDKAEDYS